MTKRLAALGALLFVALTHCASGVADSSAPPSTARVGLLSIEPAAGTAVDESTVLVAEIRYDIEHFHPKADYYIAPLFASTRGGGQTFNMLDRFTDATRVTTASGTAIVRYGIARELKSDQLARPVEVFFFLMERIGPHQTRVIGSVGPVTYK